MQYCRIIFLDNNNSVKFTNSREDNSTTNDSMVMKIAHAQLHMYTNIMYKFQNSTCKRRKAPDKIVSTDRWTANHGDSSLPPSTTLWGYNEQFLLFPQCFLPIWRTFCPFYQIWNCLLQTLSVWKSPKFVVWERINLTYIIVLLQDLKNCHIVVYIHNYVCSYMYVANF